MCECKNDNVLNNESGNLVGFYNSGCCKSNDLLTPEEFDRLKGGIWYIQSDGEEYDSKPTLSFNEYQERAASTAIYKEGNEGRELFYVALGLAGEAGEVAGEVSKLIRDEKGVLNESRRTKLIKEVGDVMWFLAQTCTELGVSMEEVAQGNLDKLASRKERGVLSGSGGDR